MWILVGSVAGLLLVAAVPVEAAFWVERHEGKGRAGGTLSWLFGVARIRLGADRRRARAARQRPAGGRQRGKRRAAGRLTAMLETEGALSRALRLVRDVLRSIRIRQLSLRARLGLDDPADTGRLWAVVGPLAGALSLLPVAHIAVEPQFTTEVFDIDLRSRVRVIPLRLLFAALLFVLSPVTLRALRAGGAAAR